jgi:DNA polymerase
MLLLLDGMVSKCTECVLYKGGRVKPYWTPMSIYAAVGEAPGAQEVAQNEPFVGKAGEILAESMAKVGFRKEQFLFINSVNCRPTDGSKNSKPSLLQVDICRKWMRKYIKVLNPEKIIGFGNFARGSLSGNYTGIIKYNGWVDSIHPYNKRVVYSVHPAYCIYNQSDGEKKLDYAIERFRNLDI